MNPFTTALIKAPKRARFDFSHDNTLSVSLGEACPSLTEFIVPGDEVSVSMEQIVRLAPMPVPTFVPLKVRHDFFFVPLRILYGQDNMDNLFGNPQSGLERACAENLQNLYDLFTGFYFSESDSKQSLTITDGFEFPFSSSLLDYLGYPVLTDRNGGINSDQMEAISSDLSAAIENAYSDIASNSNSYIYSALVNSPKINIEPIFCYHFIWRDWYRFTGIEDNDIVEPYLNNHVLAEYQSLIEGTVDESIDGYVSSNLVSEETTNRIKIGDLGKKFRVHFKKDMFTSARYGSKPTVLIPTGASGTIPALRQASAIQRFLDIVSITGQRYFDKVKGLFGVEPAGPKDDRVQFLGRYQSYIKIGEVLTTATTNEAQTGDYAGRGILVDGRYIFKRRFTEHGWLMCITSVVPELSYSGLNRQLTDVSPLDSPIPSMAQVGDQTIFCREVNFDFSNRFDHGTSYNANNRSFGDQFRYYAYKSHNNEVHGSFLMETMRSWSPLQTMEAAGYQRNGGTNVISYSKVRPEYWNYLFNDTDFEHIWGDRFFMNLNFGMSITRCLPKYINYHL